MLQQTKLQYEPSWWLNSFHTNNQGIIASYNIQSTIPVFWLAKTTSINPKSVQKSKIECKMVKLKLIDSSNKIELGQTKWFEIGRKMETPKSLYSSSARSTKLVIVKCVRQEINTNPLRQKQNWTLTNIVNIIPFSYKATNDTTSWTWGCKCSLHGCQLFFITLTFKTWAIK